MNVAKHPVLLVQGVVVWGLFWLAGLPGYYQQYSPVTVAVVCVLVSVAISLAALLILLRGRSETKLRRAVWISFYYTVPFAVLDWLYCGVYLGHGTAFLVRYWYLTVFYFTPWLSFVPTALLLRKGE
jgi:small basic protein